jgi:hypothetical protein
MAKRKVYEVTRTITFVWEVEAGSKEEAISYASDLGETRAGTRYGGEKAKYLYDAIKYANWHSAP